MSISNFLKIISVIAFVTPFTYCQELSVLDEKIEEYNTSQTIMLPSVEYLDCPKNMMPAYYINNLTSKVEAMCDCQTFYAYFSDSNSCEPAFRQGPCPEHHYVYLSPNKTDPECLKNTCMENDYVPYAGGCFLLGGEQPCPEYEMLYIDQETLQLKCIPSHLPANPYFLELPVRCVKGTRLDRLGRCRPALTN